MQKILKNVFIAVAGMFLLVGNGFCDGFEQGEIVELIPEAGLIQVNNHIFKVGRVTVVSEEKEYSGDIRELKEGGIVRIVVGKKTAKYWEADLVTLYSGDMAQKIADGMDLSEFSLSEKETRLDRATTTESSSDIRLINGVWKN